MLKSAKDQAYGIDWKEGSQEERASFLQGKWIAEQFHVEDSYEKFRHSLCFHRDIPVYASSFQEGRDRLTAIRVLRMLGRWDVPC